MKFNLTEGKHTIKIFAGSTAKDFGEKVINHLNQNSDEETIIKLGNSKLQRFKDGELQPSLEETVRGSYVFIIQSLISSDSIMELLLMIDAAFRASAYKVIAVIPYFGYARQDRKDKPRVPIGAKLLANMIYTAGASRIMTMDLHADQIQGFFDIPVDHLYASNIFIPYIKEHTDPDKLVIAAPDIGGSKRANWYSQSLRVPMVICYKEREKPNQVAKMQILGSVKDKDVVIVDDIVDTGGTLIKAAQLMKEKGARRVKAFITHGIFSDNAMERIEKSAIDRLYITDTRPITIPENITKIKVLSVAGHFAEVIWRVYTNKSISSIFIQK